MAINIDQVYKTVLLIINKEQRGYITPQEFNYIADQVQYQIFESYFPDGNQVNRLNQNNQQNDTEFFNMFKDISYKLYPFEKEIAFTYVTANDGFIQTASPELYKIGEVLSNYTGINPNIGSITQYTNKSDFNKITRSRLTAPTQKHPLFFTTSAVITPVAPNPATPNQLLIKVSPTPNSITVNGLTAPTSPQWNFTVGTTLGQYIYDGSSSVNFELDISEKTLVIIEILKYCGIVIRDPQIVQMAAQEAQQMETNEKS